MLIIRVKQPVILLFFHFFQHLEVDYLAHYAVKRTFLAIIPFKGITHAIIPD